MAKMRVRRERNLAADHGEYVTYTRGCRCDLCRHANAVYCQQDRQTRGKDYVRNCNLRQAHGLSLIEYQELLKKQNGVCAACFKPEIGNNQYGPVPLAVDHDHETNERRGLLCMRCNRALGLLQDDPQILEQLLQYLRRYKCVSISPVP